MGDITRTPRSPSLDLQSLLAISKNLSLCKVYKCMLRRQPDKISPRHTQEKKQLTIGDPVVPSSFEDHSILGKCTSRRSKTPTHSRRRSLSRNPTRRCKTPTPKSSYLSSEIEFAPASMSTDMSTRGSKIPSQSASLSTNMRKRGTSETEIPDITSSVISPSRNISLKGTTPIIFSQSTVRRKPPPPVEKKLECTLEELCFGGVKTVKITRDAILNNGILAKEEETLKIMIKPGWRKGTKITFEGKGDEKPGYLPADVVFLIDEKQHPLFERDGNDLEIGVEIPLVNALTDCTMQVPAIGGEMMTVLFEDTIIYPGYEKVIPGQGMPNSKEDGRRGDLHIKFLIDFPTELSDQQREEAVSFLQHCY